MHSSARWIAYFRILAITLAAMQTLSHSLMISAPDGISYLEVGEAYFRGDWGNALNAYWSPLYSWLLGAMFQLFHPTPFWEFPAVKLTNFLIFLFVVYCFEFFLKSLIVRYEDFERVLIAFGYTLFLYASLRWIGVHVDSPDLLSSGFVYLAMGLLLKLNDTVDRGTFAKLGVVLGLGYLTKAVFFPFAILILLLALFCVKEQRARLLFAVTSFLIVAVPFIIFLSLQKSRITFGDSGNLNYAWFVNPVYASPNHWQGGPSGFGNPVHPTRKIHDHPPAFEFGTPLAATYAPWYDPSYWWEGLLLRFDFQKQMHVLIRNSSFYWRHFLLAYLIAVVFAIAIGRSIRRLLTHLTQQWKLLLPALCGLGLYFVSIDMQSVFNPAHPSTRYIASFVVLLFCALFPAVRIEKPGSSMWAGAASVLILGFLSFQIVKEHISWLSHTQHTQWQIAEELKSAGIVANDQIAILGDEDDHVVWARLAGARITVQITDEEQFWLISQQNRQRLLETIKRSGANAVVGSQKIPHQASSGWTSGKSGYTVHLFK